MQACGLVSAKASSAFFFLSLPAPPLQIGRYTATLTSISPVKASTVPCMIIEREGANQRIFFSPSHGFTLHCPASSAVEMMNIALCLHLPREGAHFQLPMTAIVALAKYCISMRLASRYLG